MFKTSSMFLIVIVIKCTYYVQLVVNICDRDLCTVICRFWIVNVISEYLSYNK